MQALNIVQSEELAIYALKSLPFDVEYEKDIDGTVCCWTNNGIQTWGYGATYEEAREDLLHALKDIADIIRDDLMNKHFREYDQVVYMVKILSSTDEELRQCLSGIIS